MALVKQVGVESIMLAIIGGTGLAQIKGFKDAGFKRIATPFSKSRVIIELYSKNSNTVAFLRRHGKQHNIPPHKINYKANIWALHAIGVKEIIATNAIGGINSEVCPGSFVLPDQLIDYSYGRHSTFYDEDLKHVTHIDFSVPFTEELRQTLKRSFHFSNGNSTKKRTLMNGGVYGCTQGPRLETAAEIRRLHNDGCDVVGMTLMPEAALARELGFKYAALGLCVNWAAGVKDEKLDMEKIKSIAEEGSEFTSQVICDFVTLNYSNKGLARD